MSVIEVLPNQTWSKIWLRYGGLMIAVLCLILIALALVWRTGR